MCCEGRAATGLRYAYPQSQGASVNQLVLVNRGKKAIAAARRRNSSAAANKTASIAKTTRGWSSGVCSLRRATSWCTERARSGGGRGMSRAKCGSAVRSGSTYNAGVGGAAGGWSLHELERWQARSATPAPVSPDRVHAASTLRQRQPRPTEVLHLEEPGVRSILRRRGAA